MSVSLHAVTFDCSDAARLASFWSAVLDRPVDVGATTDFASISLGENLPHWYFMKVPEGKLVKNRVHADLVARDLAADIKRIVDLGATTRDEFDEGGIRWFTLLDPEGNEFDVAASAE
jgi:predicted enzyme related to lactoylglutathione lyase